MTCNRSDPYRTNNGGYYMNKPKKSGSAIFMYTVIASMLLVSAVCFFLYYGGKTASVAVLWAGIVAFMIVYHFWVRIIVGNISKLIPINPNHWWYKERFFEPRLYRLLRVRDWKGKALTYNPEQFDLKQRTLEQIAHTMAKSELDHWLNQLIALSSILFCLLWGQFWIFLATAAASMLFDGQFIVIQRYNRPKLMRVIARKKRLTARTVPV